MEKNGVYHMPSIFFSLPESPGRNNFWDKMDFSIYHSLFRMKKATRFSTEPLSYADFISIRYVYSGEDTISTPDSSFILHRNDILLLNSGFVCSQKLSHDDDVVFTMMFEKDYLVNHILNPQAKSSIITSFIYDYVLDNPNPKNYILFHGHDNDRLPRLLEDIVMEYTHPTELGEILLQSYLQILMVEMSGCEYEFEETKDSISSIHFAEILHYIDTHLADVSLAALAKQYGYHPDYISRRIKKMTGYTYKDYLLNKRIEQVCLLLRNSDLPISEIINQCGFSNESYFYKKFKQITGMTPKIYRLKV